MSTVTATSQDVPSDGNSASCVASGAKKTSQAGPFSIIVQSPAVGMLWFAGWLFTIAIAKLGFWKAVLALVVWPYFLGVLVR